MLQARGSGHQVYKGSGQNLDSHLHYQIMFRSECYYLLLRHTTDWSFVCYTRVWFYREREREKRIPIWSGQLCGDFSFFLGLLLCTTFVFGEEWNTKPITLMEGGGISVLLLANLCCVDLEE